MGKGSQPSPPPPSQVANAQAGANADAIRESAKVSAVDQVAPWGSTTFERDGNGVPTKQVISLNPNQQATFDTQSEIAKALAGNAQTLAGYIPTDRFSIDGAPDVGRLDYDSFLPDDMSGEGVGQATYERSVARFAPELERQREELGVSLTERGIPVGSEAYEREMSRFEERENDLLENAALSATLAAGQEQNRLVGLAQQGRGQDIDDRNRFISELLAERSQPFNEASAIIQGTPALPTPSFQSTPNYQVAPPDVAGAIYNDYGIRSQNNANYWDNIARFGTLGALPFI